MIKLKIIIKKINIIPSAEDTTIDSDETLVDTYQAKINIIFVFSPSILKHSS